MTCDEIGLVWVHVLWYGKVPLRPLGIDLYANLYYFNINPLVPKHRMHYQKTFIFHLDTSFGKSNRKQGLNLC